MTRRTSLLLKLAVQVACCATAIAPVASAATLTLGEAIRLALSRNPSLAAAAWHVTSAKQHTKDMHGLDPLGVEVTAENFGGSIGNDHLETTVSGSQLFPLGGDIRARVRVAQGEERVAEAELSMQQRDVVAATETAFVTAWWMERRLEQLTAAERVAEAAIGNARERTRIGAAPPSEALRAEGTLAERLLERRNVEVELDGARRDLARQWDAPALEYDSLALPPPVLPALPPPDSLLAELQMHPSRLRAAAEVAVEEAHVRQARALRVPDLTLTAGLRKLEEFDGTAWIAGVSTSLPDFGRSGLRSAEAERTSATLRQRTVDRELQAALWSAYDSLAATRDKEEIVRNRLLPAAREALAQLQRGYRAGRFTYLDQLEAQRAALDAELTELEIVRDFWASRFALERLIGRSLDPATEGMR